MADAIIAQDVPCVTEDAPCKLCRGCGETKPATAFALHRRDGLQARCRDCQVAYRAANAAAIKERHEKYCEANATKIKQRKANWTKANEERLREKNAEKYRANEAAIKARIYASRESDPEKFRAQLKKYYENNKEAFLVYSSNRRAKKRSAGGSYTIKDVDNLMLLQRGKCAHSWCRRSLKSGYHIDHVKPLALGGSNGKENIQLLCPTCNLKKGAKDPVEFAQENGCLL